MSTDAEIEKAAADKRAAGDAAASALANWPTVGYDMFRLLLIIYLFDVLVICVDVYTICLVHDYTVKFKHVISTNYVMILVYTWINIIEQLSIYSTMDSIFSYKMRYTGNFDVCYSFMHKIDQLILLQ